MLNFALWIICSCLLYQTSLHIGLRALLSYEQQTGVAWGVVIIFSAIWCIAWAITHKQEID